MKKALAQVDPPPPGEVGRELSGAASLAAIEDALQDFTGAPRMKLPSVKRVEVKKFGRRVVVRVKFTQDIQLEGRVVNELTLRVSAAFAESVRLQLTRALRK